MSEIDVTIGIPVFNGEKYIARAIESILSQSYSRFKLIISDNCSEDGTYAICQEYAQRDNRINLYKQEANIGAIENYKFVLKKCDTPYFMWAAHDDLRSANDLEHMRNAITTTDAVVFGSYIESHRGEKSSPKVYKKNELDKFFIDAFHSGKNHYIYGLFHSDLLLNSDLTILNRSAPDTLYLLSLLKKGDFRCVDGPVFKYRVVPFSLGWQYAKSRGEWRSLIMPYPVEYYVTASKIIGHKNILAKFVSWSMAYLAVQLGRAKLLIKRNNDRQSFG